MGEEMRLRSDLSLSAHCWRDGDMVMGWVYDMIHESQVYGGYCDDRMETGQDGLLDSKLRETCVLKGYLLATCEGVSGIRLQECWAEDDAVRWRTSLWLGGYHFPTRAYLVQPHRQ